MKKLILVICCGLIGAGCEVDDQHPAHHRTYYESSGQYYGYERSPGYYYGYDQGPMVRYGYQRGGTYRYERRPYYRQGMSSTERVYVRPSSDYR